MASKFASTSFWTDTFDRALASFAQALVVVAAFDQVGVLGADWVNGLSLAGGYALASVLTSVAFRGGADEISKHTES